MQHFTDDVLDELKEKYATIDQRYTELAIKVNAFSKTLGNENAIEYLQHGLLRRLWILYRCITSIFRLFPPDRIQPLKPRDRLDVEIYLHAFLINVYGALDNLALAIAYENKLTGADPDSSFDPKAVNLFERRFKKHLNGNLGDYLRRDTITSWYRDYATNYRHALAHRIPPYVPPATWNNEDKNRYEQLNSKIEELLAAGEFGQVEFLQAEQENLGRSNPLFMHSFTEEAKPIYLHPQLVTDFVTVEEIVTTGIDHFYPASEEPKKRNRL